MKVIYYKAINKNTVIALITIEDPSYNGMCMRNIRIMETNGKLWVSLPSEGYVKDGKKEYFPVVWFKDKVYQETFKQKILNAYHEYLKTAVPHDETAADEAPF